MAKWNLTVQERDVGKRDLGSRIKARLAEWENHREEPTATSGEIGDLSQAVVQVRSELVALEQPVNTSFHDTPAEGAPAHAETVVPQVAELQAALEHEQDQSRRLMDIVAREQILHAVTLQTHRQQETAHPTRNERLTSVPIPIITPQISRELPRRVDPPISPRAYVLWVVLALCIAAGCAALAFSLVH